MTVDATLPSDQSFVADWPTYIRETRTELNSLIATLGVAAVTNAVCDSTNLEIGATADLSAASIEVVFLTGTGALTTITKGVEGMIKIFVCQSADNSFVYDADGIVGGVLRLNSFESLDVAVGDVIAFVNVYGDGDNNYGYWHEINRTIKAV